MAGWTEIPPLCKAGRDGLGDLKKYGFPYFVADGFAVIRTCLLMCSIFVNKNK
jgi:hypothetical protein